MLSLGPAYSARSTGLRPWRGRRGRALAGRCVDQQTRTCCGATRRPAHHRVGHRPPSRRGTALVQRLLGWCQRGGHSVRSSSVQRRPLPFLYRRELGFCAWEDTGGPRTDKLLIRGFGVRVPGGAPGLTCCCGRPALRADRPLGQRPTTGHRIVARPGHQPSDELGRGVVHRRCDMAAGVDGGRHCGVAHLVGVTFPFQPHRELIRRRRQTTEAAG